MVQVNLLPDSYSKRHKAAIQIKVNLRPLIFTLLGTILAILILWSILSFRLSLGQKKLLLLNKQLQSLTSAAEDVDKLKEQKKQLEREIEFMRQHLKREILWAKNLNRISNIIPAGIWIKSIDVSTIITEDNLDRYEKLNINGLAVSVEGEEMMSWIGSFMTALKKDEVFATQFAEVSLLSSKRSKFGRFEIMDFRLSCKFR
jgi:Tfp pilus assembly protein PilN